MTFKLLTYRIRDVLFMTDREGKREKIENVFAIRTCNRMLMVNLN